MKLRSAVLLLAFTSLTLAASASDTNKFALVHTSDGTNIGHASYSIDKTKTGYKLSSTFTATAANGDANNPQLPAGKPSRHGGGGSGPGRGGPANVEVQYSSDFKLNPDGSFLSGDCQSVATHTIIGLQPNKARNSMTIGLRTGPDFDSQSVPVANPDFFVIPEDDPGAIQVLMTSVVTNPHADNGYFLFFPANPDLGGNNNAGTLIVMATNPDANGTLNGKPIALKHYTINFSNAKDEIYTDATGTLMEAIIGSQGVTYVREQFALAPAP